MKSCWMYLRVPTYKQCMSRMHYGDLLLSDLVLECVHSIHCYEPFAKCTVHIVKQQEVVTYLSPVEVFANGILIEKNCLWLLYCSLLNVLIALFTGVQSANSKVSKIVTEIKNLLCLNTLCYGTKCKSVAMTEMLCAKCWNIVFINIEASYWI